jgi:hypothetical protein
MSEKTRNPLVFLTEELLLGNEASAQPAFPALRAACLAKRTLTVLREANLLEGDLAEWH